MDQHSLAWCLTVAFADGQPVKRRVFNNLHIHRAEKFGKVTFVFMGSVPSLATFDSNFPSTFSCIVYYLLLWFPTEQMLLCKSCFTLDLGAACYTLQIWQRFSQWWLCSVPTGSYPQHLFSEVCASDQWRGRGKSFHTLFHWLRITFSIIENMSHKYVV